MSVDLLEVRAWHPLPKHVRAVAGTSCDAILLETAKQNTECGRSFLFLNPSKIHVANTPSELDGMFEAIERHLAEGAYLAGFFAYECGEHLVGLAQDKKQPAPTTPLAWLGVYAEPIVFDHRSGALSGPPLPDDLEVEGSRATIHPNGLTIGYEEYAAKIAAIKEYLQAGDTYQVNFTDKITGDVEGDLLPLYEDLLQKQPVPYAAFLNLRESALLSFSPELFFHLSGRRIVVKPMKGTWARGKDIDEDIQAAARLRDDPKNRSEHVMIVDLLRNDLGKICEPGSVSVDELFSVERYRTLLQMTSTISGEVRSEVTTTQAFRNLFPSGSITGAPKRRTMEIIRELESKRRGAYTGAIGYFAPDGEACFNVAIRTLMVSGGTFTLGVGGGITADSEPENEYEECRLKGSFLTHTTSEFSLIETMRSVQGAIPLLALHLQRLERSASYFNFSFDRDSVEQQVIDAARGAWSEESRVRLELNEEGMVAITTSLLIKTEWNGKLLLASDATLSTDTLLRHKTTRRQFYDQHLAQAKRLGFDEVMFMNEHHQVTEGAISNIFLGIGERWLTPRLDCGVLPGVQRAVLLDELPGAYEGHVSLDDLNSAHSVFLCNALRGVREICKIETSEGELIWKA